MADPNLVTICFIAFAAVLGLLSLLAWVIHLISLVFPNQKTKEIDPAVVAAIQNVVATTFNGSKVVKIEETTQSTTH